MYFEILMISHFTNSSVYEQRSVLIIFLTKYQNSRIILKEGCSKKNSSSRELHLLLPCSSRIVYNYTEQMEDFVILISSNIKYPIKNGRFFVLLQLIQLTLKHCQMQNKNLPIFIRHGQSKKNQSKTETKIKILYKQDENYQKHIFNSNFMDSQLSQKGIQQCLQTRQILKNYHFEVVIVSPMRRTLFTCDLLFKNHPSRPKIIVEPLLTQQLHSSCNLGSSVSECMELFPYFDFSNLEGKQINWYVHLLEKDKKQRVLKLIQNSNCQTGKEVGQTILNYQKQNIRDFETHEQAKQRASHISNLLKEYDQRYKGKFAIVGHRKITKILCDKESESCLSASNCRPMFYNTDKRQLFHV